MNVAAKRRVAEEWRDRVGALRVWEREGVRAPHKPLLLLLAMGRAVRGEERKVRFSDVEKPLRNLLEEFGPNRKQYSPQYPFWHLQRDGLWEVEGVDAAPRRRKGKETAGEPLMGALRQQAVGALPAELHEGLRANPEAAGELAAEILSAHFPSSLHAEILRTVGLELAETRTVLLPTAFEEAVLEAYGRACAICEFHAELMGKPLAVEATPVKWLQAGGAAQIDNGLALCSIHKRAFERGAYGLDPDLRVMVSAAVRGNAETMGWLLEFRGRPVRLPAGGWTGPAMANVDWHRVEVFKAPAAG